VSSLDIPVHLALVLLLANGAPLRSGIDRDVLAAKPEVRRVARPGLGFTEARWIAAVARHGERSGLGDLSRRIFRTSSGRLYTPVETDRSAILALMADPAVTDILVNGHAQVYVERFGRLILTDVRFRDADHVLRVIERIAARVGRRIDTSCPMVDMRLPDGSRVNATVPPVSIDGPTLSIRRFGRQRLKRDDLARLNMLSRDMLTFMEIIVKSRQNVLISGGTGAGKSTMLGALAESIPDYERVVTIEDTAELILDQEHVVRLETRPANIEGRGVITTRDLVINSLRMRPDRIIVGECRGPESLDMLQAMNTGHDGGMTTVHANTPRDALNRLETMVLMAGVELPSRAIREQIVSALHFIVSVRRFDDGVRRVESIAELTGMEAGTPLLQDIYRFQQTGRNGRSIIGQHVATGIVPRLFHELRERGMDVPMQIFAKTEVKRD